MKPAARVSDPTDCPQANHGANPIVSGSADVFFEGLPAARQGDTTECGSSLVSGLSSTVVINGKPAAMVGSIGSCGNTVVSGAGTIVIGDVHTPAPFIAPTPLAIGFARSFVVRDSETGLPLVMREYTAKVGHMIVEGKTDALGLAHIRTPSKDQPIALHIRFRSPKRLLHELAEVK
jgi:uncharacterized Zn-binding protein involved in type VI secretion